MPEISKPKLVNRGAAGLLKKAATPTNGEQQTEPPAIPVGKKDRIRCKGDVINIDLLVPDPDNAREHGERNISDIMQSLAAFGQMKPLVVRKQGMVVMAGNGTLDAARMLGWSKMACSVMPMTDAEAAAYGLADNRSGESSTWNFATVARLEALISSNGIPMVGWSLEELEAMRAMGSASEQHTDPDDPPAVPKIAITKIGELWNLGNHRVLCGDSTNKATLGKLMKGEKARIVFTDPPYGVGVAAKNRLLNSVQPSGRCLVDIEDDNLNPTDLRNKLLPAFTALKSVVMADDCTVFVCSPQGGELCMMMMMMKDAGLPTRHVLIWKKNQPTFSLGRLDYDYQHEPILMTWGKRHKKIMLGQHKTSVWEIDKPRASSDHPTMKPVELVVNALENNSEVNDLLVDIYLGSGTSVIAAQKTGRRCYGVEIDPVYIDVTLTRWAEFTGSDPVRESDDMKWSQLRESSAG